MPQGAVGGGRVGVGACQFCSYVVLLCLFRLFDCSPCCNTGISCLFDCCFAVGGRVGVGARVADRQEVARAHGRRHDACLGFICVDGKQLLVERYLSDTASFVSCMFRRVKDHHDLLYYSPLLKKARARQVELDERLPLTAAAGDPAAGGREMTSSGVHRGPQTLCEEFTRLAETRLAQNS